MISKQRLGERLVFYSCWDYFFGTGNSRPPAKIGTDYVQ
jgi:hypothetical protein